MSCPLGRHLAVFSAVLLSLGTGFLGSTATRGEAAPRGRPTTLSATLPLDLGTPTVLMTLDNGQVVSGHCQVLPFAPFFDIRLELGPGISAPAMLVSGFSFVGTASTVQSGFKGGSDLPLFVHGTNTVAFALIAGPSDEGGNPLGSFVRIDIQGSPSVGPGNVPQCSFWGLIVPSG